MPRGKKKSVKEPKEERARQEPAAPEPEPKAKQETKPEPKHEPETTPKQGDVAKFYFPPKDPKWDLTDPKIKKSDKGRRWVAIFRCTNPDAKDPVTGLPTIHKVKATNLTPASDVPCHKCGWPTEMMDLFKNPPVDYRAMRVREPDGGDFEGASDA